MIDKYGDDVHFVVLYVTEPHPIGSPSPYSGEEWPLSNSYDNGGNPVRQPLTYEERVQLAALCVADAGITSLVLVDKIENPVWQVYGSAPNSAYLVDTDRKIMEAQLWYDVDEMEAAIERLIR